MKRLTTFSRGVHVLGHPAIARCLMSCLPPTAAAAAARVCKQWHSTLAGPQGLYWRDITRQASLPELLRPAVWLTAAAPSQVSAPWLGRALGQTPPSGAPSPRRAVHAPAQIGVQLHPCLQHSLALLHAQGGSQLPPSTLYGDAYWAATGLEAEMKPPQALYDSALSLASALETQSDAGLELSGTRRRQARLKTQEAGLLQAAIESSLGDVAAAQASGDIAKASSARWGGRTRFDSSATVDTASTAPVEVEGGDVPEAQDSTEANGSPPTNRRSLWARLSMRRRKPSDGSSPLEGGEGGASCAFDPSPLVDVTAQTRSVSGLPDRTPRGRRASKSAGGAASRSAHVTGDDAVGLRGNVGISCEDAHLSSSRSVSPASGIFCGADETGSSAGAEHGAVNVATAATTPSAFSTASATAFSELTPSSADGTPPDKPPPPPLSLDVPTVPQPGLGAGPGGSASAAPPSTLQVPLASGLQSRPGQVIAGYHGLTAAQQSEWHEITAALQALQPTIEEQLKVCAVADAAVQRAAGVMCQAAAAVSCSPPQVHYTCIQGPWNTLVPASPFLHDCAEWALTADGAPSTPPLHWKWESTHAQIDADVGRTFGEIVLAHDKSRGGDASDSDDAEQVVAEADLPAVTAHTLPGAAAVRHLRGSLRRVLLAFAVLDPHVGYCQGMNFMAALLLRVFNGHEVTVLHMLLLLVRRYGLSRMFSSGLSGAAVAFKQLDASLAHCIPMLSRHLASQEISCAMFGAGWYMTVFSSQSTLPCRTVARVWDSFLLEGWQAVHRTSVALLGLCAGRLLAHDFMVNVQFLLTSLPLALKDAVSATQAAHASAQHAAREALVQDGQAYTASPEQLSVMSPAPAAAVSRAAMVHCEDHAFGQAAGKLLLRKAKGYDILNSDLNRLAEMLVAAGAGRVYTTATAARAFGGVAADVVVDGSLRAAAANK